MDRLVALFDMDGLMLDSERMARSAWTRALADHGYHLEAQDYLRLLGRTVGDARGILTEIFGPDLPYDQVFEQRLAYYQADIDANGIPVKPGLLDLLDFLELHGVPKAVASSTPAWFVRRKLVKVGIFQRFSVVVCGDMVPRGKPYPDLFLEAARRLNAAPGECVVLEDSEAGIRAANRAAMLALMVPDLKPPTPEIQAMAYRVLPSLKEAIPLFERFIREGLPAVPPAVVV